VIRAPSVEQPHERPPLPEQKYNSRTIMADDNGNSNQESGDKLTIEMVRQVIRSELNELELRQNKKFKGLKSKIKTQSEATQDLESKIKTMESYVKAHEGSGMVPQRGGKVPDGGSLLEPRSSWRRARLFGK